MLISQYRRREIKTRTFLLIFVLMISATSACGLDTAQPTGTPPVVQLMPNLDGFDVIEGQAVQEYIANLAEGAALLAANPQMVLLIERVDRVTACYQEAGAFNARVFIDEDYPLSSGAIAIADRNRLTDPAILFGCVGGQISPLSSQPEIDSCSHSYTLARDNNEFYIIYVGTTQEICQTFCQNLEDCTAH